MVSYYPVSIGERALNQRNAYKPKFLNEYLVSSKVIGCIQKNFTPKSYYLEDSVFKDYLDQAGFDVPKLREMYSLTPKNLECVYKDFSKYHADLDLSSITFEPLEVGAQWLLQEKRRCCKSTPQILSYDAVISLLDLSKSATALWNDVFRSKRDVIDQMDFKISFLKFVYGYALGEAYYLLWLAIEKEEIRPTEKILLNKMRSIIVGSIYGLILGHMLYADMDDKISTNWFEAQTGIGMSFFNGQYDKKMAPYEQWKFKGFSDVGQYDSRQFAYLQQLGATVADGVYGVRTVKFYDVIGSLAPLAVELGMTNIDVNVPYLRSRLIEDGVFGPTIMPDGIVVSKGTGEMSGGHRTGHSNSDRYKIVEYAAASKFYPSLIVYKRNANTDQTGDDMIHGSNDRRVFDEINLIWKSFGATVDSHEVEHVGQLEYLGSTPLLVRWCGMERWMPRVNSSKVIAGLAFKLSERSLETDVARLSSSRVLCHFTEDATNLDYLIKLYIKDNPECKYDIRWWSNETINSFYFGTPEGEDSAFLQANLPILQQTFSQAGLSEFLPGHFSHLASYQGKSVHHQVKLVKEGISLNQNKLTTRFNPMSTFLNKYGDQLSNRGIEITNVNLSIKKGTKGCVYWTCVYYIMAGKSKQESAGGIDFNESGRLLCDKLGLNHETLPKFSDTIMEIQKGVSPLDDLLPVLDGMAAISTDVEYLLKLLSTISSDKLVELFNNRRDVSYVDFVGAAWICCKCEVGNFAGQSICHGCGTDVSNHMSRGFGTLFGRHVPRFGDVMPSDKSASMAKRTRRPPPKNRVSTQLPQQPKKEIAKLKNVQRNEQAELANLRKEMQALKSEFRVNTKSKVIGASIQGNHSTLVKQISSQLVCPRQRKPIRLSTPFTDVETACAVPFEVEPLVFSPEAADSAVATQIPHGDSMCFVSPNPSRYLVKYEYKPAGAEMLYNIYGRPADIQGNQEISEIPTLIWTETYTTTDETPRYLWFVKAVPDESSTWNIHGDILLAASSKCEPNARAFPVDHFATLGLTLNWDKQSGTLGYQTTELMKYLKDRWVVVARDELEYVDVTTTGSHSINFLITVAGGNPNLVSGDYAVRSSFKAILGSIGDPTITVDNAWEATISSGATQVDGWGYRCVPGLEDNITVVHSPVLKGGDLELTNTSKVLDREGLCKGALISGDSHWRDWNKSVSETFGRLSTLKVFHGETGIYGSLRPSSDMYFEPRNYTRIHPVFGLIDSFWPVENTEPFLAFGIRMIDVASRSWEASWYTDMEYQTTDKWRQVAMPRTTSKDWQLALELVKRVPVFTKNDTHWADLWNGIQRAAKQVFGIVEDGARVLNTAKDAVGVLGVGL